MAGVEVHRLNLVDVDGKLTWPDRLRFVVRTLVTARRLGRLDAIVTGLHTLVPVGAAAATLTGTRHAPVLYYLQDVWMMRPFKTAVLRHHPSLFPVTISNYTAGALSMIDRAPIIAPSIAPSWRSRLLAEGARRSEPAEVPTILSVFRLPDWKGKGLRTLLAGVAGAREVVGPVHLVVAGQGPAPTVVRELIASHQDVELHETPPDDVLTRMYGTADLFALCTRTDPPHDGEGYGMVLLEAQLAGCAVVGPASGGCREAYREGITGLTPRDESAAALTHTLIDLLSDRHRLAEMGRAATRNAEAVTRPEDFIANVVNILVGGPGPARPHKIPKQTRRTAPATVSRQSP
ncbi:glycosyltransferase [Parafrankia sp. BMG5.11]|nr:glycosyltransferase [Parafrankia sp. BMG5.11]